MPSGTTSQETGWGEKAYKQLLFKKFLVPKFQRRIKFYLFLSQKSCTRQVCGVCCRCVCIKIATHTQKVALLTPLPSFPRDLLFCESCSFLGVYPSGRLNHPTTLTPDQLHTPDLFIFHFCFYYSCY